MFDFLNDLDMSVPERLKMKTYNESGEIITEWDEEKGWFEDGTEQNEYGEWLMNRIYHPYTEAELRAIDIQKQKEALLESRRQLTLDEVLSIFVKNQINNTDIPDQTSLRMMAYYPSFEDIVGQTVKQGYKFIFEDRLYKTVQPNLTIQQHYPPGAGTESLYVHIDEEHSGSIVDPIPYEGNMELFNGKYYVQNDVVYYCNRDTGTAVYHALSNLVGLYVELA